jgi:quinol monooxygenase YgiN
MMTGATGDEVAAIIRSFRAELPDPPQPLALLVRFTVDKADGEKVVAAFGAARPLTLKEAGCMAFRLNREPHDPGRFVVYEQWRNLAALEGHLRTDYISKLRALLDTLIVGAPEFQVLLPVA